MKKKILILSIIFFIIIFCLAIFVFSSFMMFFWGEDFDDGIDYMTKYNPNNKEIDLGDGFIKSGDDIYFHLVYSSIDNFYKLKLDSNSFKNLGSSYVSDKNNIYYFSVDLKMVIPHLSIIAFNDGTFKVLKYDYAKNDTSIYFHSSEIKEADHETFEVFENQKEHSYLAKDKNNVFYYGEKFIFKNDIKPDIKTLSIIGKNYFKDKNSIFSSYCGGNSHLFCKIESADYYTFEVIENEEVKPNSYAKDKFNCYNFGTMVIMSECEKEIEKQQTN